MRIRTRRAANRLPAPGVQAEPIAPRFVTWVSRINVGRDRPLDVDTAKRAPDHFPVRRFKERDARRAKTRGLVFVFMRTERLERCWPVRIEHPDVNGVTVAQASRVKSLPVVIHHH